MPHKANLRVVPERSPLDALIRDAATLSRDEVLGFIGDAARLTAVLEARLIEIASVAPVAVPQTSVAPGLLTARQVAERLNTTVDWVYQRAEKLGAVRLDKATLRFSEAKLAEYVKAGGVCKIQDSK
jgi:hypothetical protein